MAQELRVTHCDRLTRGACLLITIINTLLVLVALFEKF